MIQPDLFPDPAQGRPLAGCVTPGWRAWKAMQDTFAKAELRAVRAHGRINAIRAERQAIVHAALAGAR